MSFFKFLTSVFKKDEEPKKSDFQEQVKSITLPETAQEANKRKAEYMRKAAEATLELCTGIPNEIKKNSYRTIPKNRFL